MNYLLLQGVFFQDYPGGFPVNENFNGFEFSGVIFPQAHVGRITDNFGKSTLSDIIIEETAISFTKRYNNRPSIRFMFSKKDSIWVGQFKGEDTGVGTAKCIITEVPDDFFDLPR